MKVLFIINTLASGGKERRLSELLKHLVLFDEVKFELVIMSTDVHYRQVFDLGVSIHFIIRRTKKDLSVFFKTYKLIRNYRPDIVHCWDSMTAVYAAPICKMLKIKLVNGMVIDVPVRRNLLNKHWLRARITFPLSSRIVGNSKAGLLAYHAPKSKSVCIYNGIRMSRFAGLKDPTLIKEEIFRDRQFDGFVIGMVAAFEDRKDYSTLVDAAMLVCKDYDNVKFVFVGEGTKMSIIKNKVLQEYIDKVLFLGKRTDVESIINIFDLGVLLTNSNVHGEGISNSILEYMALAKPVIATRGGGTGEIVIDGQTGFLVSPGDPKEVSERIVLLMKDRDLCKSIGLNARESITGHFSISHMVDRYINLYKTLSL